MRKLLILCLITFLSLPALAAEKESANTKTEKENKKSKKAKAKVLYYTLVDASVKPEETEFYVKSIFQARGKVKASIARSNNTRSGNMYTLPLAYGIGDKLTDSLVISNIVVSGGRYIEVYKPSTDEYYVLRMSYGKAKSRLIPKNKKSKSQPKIGHKTSNMSKNSSK